MSTAEQIANDQDLVDKIGKLLAVAASTKNDAEREAFEARAFSLMEANNLDMAAIEQGGSSAKAARRADEKLKGGLYQFQRDIFKAVASLHFCMYWCLRTYDADKTSAYWARKFGGKANVPESYRGGFSFQHRLVGRTVNIASTRVMSEYILGRIEQLVKDRYPGQPNSWFSSEATAFREGVADEVEQKIYQRRREQLKVEEDKKREAEEAAAAKRGANVSLGTEMTLSTVKENEEAGNYDFLHGDGAWAKKQARVARWAAEREEADRAYTKWAKENPKEAAKQEEERRKQERKTYRTSWNAGMGRDAKSERQRSGEYWRGRKEGEKISIDPQMGNKTAGLLR